MKKLLLTLAVLLACLDCLAQFHIEDGTVYCDNEYLIIGRIQANFFDDMAVCQHPSGYAFMLLEGDKVLVTVELGETKEQAMEGMDDLIRLVTQAVPKSKEFHLKDMHGKDVSATVYPREEDALRTKARLFSTATNLGSGIMLTNNLHCFNKILAKYPTVRFK